MKTILKNIMLFAAGALTLGFTACEEDGQDLNFNIQPGNELYAPAANASVNLDQGLNTSFEWAPSVAEDGGYITYEVLFDKADGDFSAPLAIKTSQMTGSKASLSISAKELNEVAALAGIENAKTGQIKWTVRAGKGLFSQTYTQANVLTVSRIPAYLDGKAVGSGVYECFTKISEGEFTVVDELDRYYSLKSNGRIKHIVDGSSTANTLKAGIYWIKIDFSAMTYTAVQVSMIEYYAASWADNSMSTVYKTLTYKGKGVWELLDYDNEISVNSSNDTRHRFNMTTADGNKWFLGTTSSLGSSSPSPVSVFSAGSQLLPVVSSSALSPSVSPFSSSQSSGSSSSDTSSSSSLSAISAASQPFSACSSCSAALAASNSSSASSSACSISPITNSFWVRRR